MEIEVSSSSNLVEVEEERSFNKDRVRVKRKTLKTVLEQCQRALELLSSDNDVLDEEDDDDDDEVNCSSKLPEDLTSETTSVASPVDQEAYELCDLLKSRVECADFLQKLECAQVSVPQNIAEDGSSWDMVNENDLWGDENVDSEEEDYVLVRQEDIVDGIACFMAAYLLSIKQTKDLTPNQLQEALSKTFSVKKEERETWKAWDGSKVIYNVASWGQLPLGYTKTQLFLGLLLKHSGLLVMLYQSFSEVHDVTWVVLWYWDSLLCLYCQCSGVFLLLYSILFVLQID